MVEASQQGWGADVLRVTVAFVRCCIRITGPLHDCRGSDAETSLLPSE